MNILFFGGMSWFDGGWFRRQHFAYRLSLKGHRIIYVEKLEALKNVKFLHEFKSKITKVNENLMVLKPSHRLPLKHSLLSNYIYNYMLLLQLRIVFKQLNFQPDIIWTNNINYWYLIKKLNRISILDLVDDLPYYMILAKNFIGYRRAMYNLYKTFQLTDIHIVTAKRLEEKYREFSKKGIIQVSNGHNIDIGKKEYVMPIHYQKISKPIILFVGTLFSFIDEKLLKFIIKDNPCYNFIFIGKIEKNFDFSALSTYNNVFHLGFIPREEIENYIYFSDICINPFKVHEVNHSVSPVKVFEYLAQKKHVISTDMYSLRREKISRFIHFAKDKIEFSFLLKKVIDSNELINYLPEEIIMEYHWDSLYKKLLNEINDKHNLLF